jgi:ferrochelatase|tara:strand:- start:1790 stop:2779 length:990 start_codon:yes stop_codon:yes gene_type:complete
MSTNVYHENRTDHHAIIIVNLGSPATPTYFDIMRFLREFLSDHRVIKLPKVLWYPILYGFILPFRSRGLIHSYEMICDGKAQPLLETTKRLAEKMDERTPETTHVRHAFRYGKDNIEKAISELRATYPIKKLTILPLFPQFSASTTGSVFDALSQWASKQNFLWNTKFIHTYHQHPAYLEAVCNQIKRHWKEHGQKHLLLTYHGLPKVMLTEGDPYYCYCMQTSRLLAQQLGLNETEYTTSFQSRFGRQEWLKPYTEDVLKELAKEHRKIDAICPGFAADCLETIEEVKVTYAEQFVEFGGESLTLIPCLNDHDDHARALIAISGPDAF